MDSKLLREGKDISLFTKSTIIVIKSTSFDLETNGPSPFPEEKYFDLYNKDGDITLRIGFRKGQKKIFCNDRASKSIGDGWGKERSTDLGPMGVDRSKGITISVYAVSSHRYQVLVDLTTVCFFDSRFSGPAERMAYPPPAGILLVRTILSNNLRVKQYEIRDLPPDEKQAIESGRAPVPEIAGPDSTAISIRPSHFIPNQTYASISWDEGREIRTYHLGPGNILQEYAYSESKDRNSLYYGELHKLNIVLDPTSSIAAVRHRDEEICVFFQDPNDGFIRILRKSGTSGEWRKYPAEVAKAVKGSSIAVIMDTNGPVRYWVYYQDPELRLRENYSNPSASQWLPGDFYTGVQPRRTPITAEVVRGGSVDINVTWRDEEGRVASRSWSNSSGWDLPNTNSGGATPDGRD